jgi:tetratricopeptide (TPR) repeat protein
MKNNITFYLTIICVFSFNSFAQKNRPFQGNKTMKSKQEIMQSIPEKKNNSIITIKLYHVQEIINMQFGGYTTTYTVTDSSLIRTNDLGPNNTRVITIRYVNYPKRINYNKKNSTNKMLSKSVFDTVQSRPQPHTSTSAVDTLDHHGDYIYIMMIKTFERVADKGYKSVEIFQKLGNAYYYISQMDKAAKWYEKLFAMTTNLEPEYYYRYAQSLRSIGENDKADELLEKFNQLTGNKAR